MHLSEAVGVLTSSDLTISVALDEGASLCAAPVRPDRQPAMNMLTLTRLLATALPKKQEKVPLLAAAFPNAHNLQEEEARALMAVVVLAYVFRPLVCRHGVLSLCAGSLNTPPLQHTCVHLYDDTILVEE